jgi:hypothetical protein
MLLFTVDEHVFYSGLESADSSPSASPQSKGVFACAFMMASVCTKLQGDDIGAQRYCELGRDHIDEAMRGEPTQHLVSALLLLHLLPPQQSKAGQSLAHITLAQRLAEFLPGLSTVVRFASAGLKYMHACTSGDVLWPPHQATIGV